MSEPLPGQFLSMQPAAAREVLLTIAGNLRTIFTPGFPGDISTRTNECIQMLARVAQQLSAPSATVQSLLGSDAVQEGAAIDATEDELQALLVSIDSAASTGTKTYDQAKLEQYLQQHAMGSPSLRIASAKQLQGGRSKQTILVTLQNQGGQLPAELVVRQDWHSSVTGTSVVSEFEVVLALSKAGLKVPRPLFLEPSASSVGSAFVVVTRLPGRAEGNIFSPPKSETLALELAEQLGKLHALKAEQFESLAGISTKAYTQAQLRTDLDGFRALYAKLDSPSKTLDAVFAWLAAHIEQVQGQRALVHTDIGFHNLLVHEGHLTGVLDWELAHIGNPAEDLGYCKGDIEQMTTWPRFMQAYHAAGGPQLSSFLIDFYTLWGDLRLYSLLWQARAAINSGMLRDAEVAYASVHMMSLLLARMSRQLRDILQRN